MAFNVGDVVIINGMYSGQIIRANVERDMYVVKYRHPSESKPIKTMHRASELDLVRKARSNPTHEKATGLPSKPETLYPNEVDNMSVEEKWEWIDAAGEYVEAYLDKVVPQIDADDWESGDLGFTVEQSGLSASKYYEINDERSDTQFKIRISDHRAPSSAADHAPPDYDLRPGKNVDLLIREVNSYLTEISQARRRSNPSCYPDDGVHSPPMADFRGWRIAVSFLGESGIKYVDPKTKSYTSVPRFTAPPITDWLEVVAALDELENDPQISVLGDSLEVEEVADAPDVFLEGWYDPIFFQSYNDDGTQITNRSEWDLIGFLGPFPDGNVFVDGLLHLYDGNMRDYRFKTILSFDKQEYGNFVIGDKVSVLKTIAGRKMTGGSQRSGRHAFDIATREGSNSNWNYFTSEEDLQEYAEKYYLPHTLFQRKFSKCFLGYFRGAEMAGNFGQAFDHPLNNPLNINFSFSYLDLLGGYSSIYARMEKNIDEICTMMSKSVESSFKRPSPFVDDLIDDLEEAIRLPADHPDYEESYHSKMLTGMLDEAIKTDAMARELGWIKKPGPKGRTEEDILRELRGENEWLAPYIERSKNKMNQNPSLHTPRKFFVVKGKENTDIRAWKNPYFFWDENIGWSFYEGATVFDQREAKSLIKDGRVPMSSIVEEVKASEVHIPSMRIKGTFKHQSLGETLEFAEDLGWEDTYPDSSDPSYTPEMADSMEEEALEYIKSQGFTVVDDNPSVLTPSDLKQKAAIEAAKRDAFEGVQISTVDDVIIEEMPSPTIPNFSVLFLTSPLKYKKYGPSVSPFRIALCDDRIEEPQSKKDMYFGDYEEWRTHSKRGYKRLKKPVLEQIIPGVGNDCIVAFLDYTTRGDNGFYIDYMRVRRGFEGQGIARALVESFYSEVAQDGDVVNWGKMMNEKVEHLMESMQEEFPHITSLGTPNF